MYIQKHIHLELIYLMSTNVKYKIKSNKIIKLYIIIYIK